MYTHIYIGECSYNIFLEEYISGYFKQGFIILK